MADERPSPRFRFIRVAFTIVSSLMVPLAFGMAFDHVPLHVKVVMATAAAFHIGEYLFALWAREKADAKRRSQPPPIGQVLFTGDDARQLNELAHNLANKPQRTNMQ